MKTRLVPALFAAGLALSSGASAATVANITTAGVSQSTTSAIDLDPLGTFNWAVWDDRPATTTPRASLSSYATKTGGSGTIGPLLPGGNSSNVRGTNVTGSYPNTFTWTGGSAAVTADGKLTGGFGSNVNNVNNGVRLTVSTLAPLAAGLSYQISVLAAVYNGQGTLTATTGTSSDFQLSVNAPSTGQRLTQLFQFSYTPESISDTLNLAYVLTTDGSGDSSHVTIQAVAISIIPEPSAMLLGAIGGTLGLSRRRRR